MVSRGVQWAYLGVLAIALGYAILKGGGSSPVDWNVSGLLIGLVGLVYWLGTSPAERAPAVRPWLGWALALAPSYVALQLVPLPVFLLSILSPTRAHTVASLGTVMPPPTFASLSVNGAVTVAHLLHFVTYTITFLLVREVAWRCWQRRSWAPAIPLIAVAAVQAWLGLSEMTDASGMQGTYRSKNEFAGLLEMVLPMTIACGMALLQAEPSRRLRRYVRALAGCIVLITAGVMLLALAHSLSKMGFVAGLAGLFVMGVLAVVTRLRRAKQSLSLAALTVSCALVFVFLPTDQFVRNFGYLLTEDATGEARYPIWGDTLHLFLEYPLFGAGLGNYGTAFLKHQTAAVDWAFTFAHNDYLQLASELGAIGFSICIGLLLLVITSACRAATDREWQIRALGLGCVGAITAIALHSFADFNLYIPANALLLAWISGIAVSLRIGSRVEREIPGRALFRIGPIVCAALLVVYASAALVAETVFRDNARAKQLFCQFGVCYTGRAIDPQEHQHDGAVAAPMPELLEALRSNAVDPDRWCDVGEAMLRAGRVEDARKSFANALALGPNIPPVLLKAANFYYDLGEPKRALAHTSRVLAATDTYDEVVFDWYMTKELPVTEILAEGLPSGPRASQAYLEYLMRLENFDAAEIVWDWALSRRYPDEQLARDYVHFLYGGGQYEAAARSWARFLGERRNGYLESNWLFNGDFESAPSGVVFDWRMENLNDEVKVEIDASATRSGARSLRVGFGGKENVTYNHTSQTAFVTPGVYLFRAFVRARDITTDQGLGFHIFDPEDSGRVDVRTPHVVGTCDWKTVEQLVRVPPETRLLVVAVARQRSLKFDSHIGGTVWVDDVTLARIE